MPPSSTVPLNVTTTASVHAERQLGHAFPHEFTAGAVFGIPLCSAALADAAACVPPAKAADTLYQVFAGHTPGKLGTADGWVGSWQQQLLLIFSPAPVPALHVRKLLHVARALGQGYLLRWAPGVSVPTSHHHQIPVVFTVIPASSKLQGLAVSSAARLTDSPALRDGVAAAQSGPAVPLSAQHLAMQGVWAGGAPEGSNPRVRPHTHVVHAGGRVVQGDAAGSITASLAAQEEL